MCDAFNEPGFLFRMLGFFMSARYAQEAKLIYFVATKVARSGAG
jgi:hypothetical protein